MYFPISGVEISPWIPPLVAFVVSFFTSMGGVSGAFLLLPFQMSVLGFTSPAVSATNQLFNIVAIPSGVARYMREGRMVWPLAWVVIIGTLPGVLLGAIIRIKLLPDPTAFKVFAGVVLLYIGARMARDLLSARKGQPSAQAVTERRFHQAARLKAQSGSPSPAREASAGAVTTRRSGLLRISYEFAGELFEAPSLTILTLSFVVGIVGGVYGIGGGAIIAPFFVAFLGLPVYTVAGAALLGTLITSVAGVAFYQAMAPLHPEVAVAPDWLLGLLFGLGGAAGMYCGARAQRYVPARLIKCMLMVVILLVALRYLLGLRSLL